MRVGSLENVTLDWYFRPVLIAWRRRYTYFKKGRNKARRLKFVFLPIVKSERQFYAALFVFVLPLWHLNIFLSYWVSLLVHGHKHIFQTNDGKPIENVPSIFKIDQNILTFDLHSRFFFFCPVCLLHSSFQMKWIP